MPGKNESPLADAIEHFRDVGERKISDVCKSLCETTRERVSSSVFVKIHEALTELKGLDFTSEERQYYDLQAEILFKSKFPDAPFPATNILIFFRKKGIL